MEDAAAQWDSMLTEARLYRWQAALFPDGYASDFASLRRIETGRYRLHAEPMQIVSGPIGKEVVHYEAPPSAAVRAEMNQLIDWFNRSFNNSRPGKNLQLDGIVRAGLMHLWFETVHPFEDGNGRV